MFFQIESFSVFIKENVELKKIILSIVMAIILTGCNVLSPDIVKQPEGKVVLDNTSYTMMPGDYQWEEDNVAIKTKSYSDIHELADQFETLEVDKGDTLTFEIEKNPSSITIIRLNEDGTDEIVEMKDYTITMPSEEGYYVYELKAIWSKGKETFVFDVQVK
jgi:plastocyanin